MSLHCCQDVQCHRRFQQHLHIQISYDNILLKIFGKIAVALSKWINMNKQTYIN